MTLIAALLSLLLLAVAPASPSGAEPPRGADATFADTVQAHYAAQEPDQLRQMLDRADTQLQELLVRYRLYPLTEDVSVIDDVPSELEDGSARELAILSGIWAYRAGEASFINAARYGRRSVNLLEDAREADPDEPYVLLVGGQSYLFRPAIAGRDAEKAVRHFQKLLDRLDAHPDIGISPDEARTWLWLSLREAGRDEEAGTVHGQMTKGSLDSLYREFLEDPPDV